MRNFIIGLSCIFFFLSGIVLYKALNIPVTHTQYKANPEESEIKAPAAKAGAGSAKYPLEQPVNESVAQDLQAATDMVEDQGPARNAGMKTNDETSGTGNKTRVLAVIGAGAFNSGQIVVNDSLINTVKKVVPDILDSPGYRVHVEGHTDNIPIKASDKRYLDNMELSFLRAKAVASILVENGVSPDRISITGYGETRPIASNETFEGRIENRRVEIKLVPGDKEL